MGLRNSERPRAVEEDSMIRLGQVKKVLGTHLCCPTKKTNSDLFQKIKPVLKRGEFVTLAFVKELQGDEVLIEVRVTTEKEMRAAGAHPSLCRFGCILVRIRPKPDWACEDAW